MQEFAEAIALSQVCETKAIVNVTPALNVNLITAANKTIFNLGNNNELSFMTISGATSGIAYITMGGWITDHVEAPNGPNPVWVKQGCGSIQLYFCPGQGFFFGRNNAVEA